MHFGGWNDQDAPTDARGGQGLEVAGELLSYEEMPEALEYRQSQNLASDEASMKDGSQDR